MSLGSRPPTAVLVCGFALTTFAYSMVLRV